MCFVFDDSPELAPDARVARIPAGITSARALLEALHARLPLPGYFGFNWNALSDCLRDLSWIPELHVVLCHADLPPLPEAELRSYLEVLTEAMQSWQPGEPHSLHVIFPASAQPRATALVARPAQ